MMGEQILPRGRVGQSLVPQGAVSQWVYIDGDVSRTLVGAQGQFVQVPGPVQYRRKYTLWVLILLVLVCWPVAIIYYFTRDKVPVQEFQSYQTSAAPPPAAAQGGTSGLYCPSCGAAVQQRGGFCPSCGKTLPP